MESGVDEKIAFQVAENEFLTVRKRLNIEKLLAREQAEFFLSQEDCQRCSPQRQILLEEKAVMEKI